MHVSRPSTSPPAFTLLSVYAQRLRAGPTHRVRPIHSRSSSEKQPSSSTGESPSLNPPPSPHQPNPSPAGPNGSISDHEWNLRAGRAVYTLRTTLPMFFETGLMSSAPPAADTSSSSLPRRQQQQQRDEGDLSIYAPNIRLSYSPPSAWSLPAPFPKTLQVEGLPLYHASATFIRHTLSAFYHDLRIDLRGLHVRSSSTAHHTRMRSIVVRMVVIGKSRISGMRNEWDVHSTYSLSPHTALIDLHTVESIHPAPHVTFYDGLRAALARLAALPPPSADVGGVRGCVEPSDPRCRSVPLREPPSLNWEKPGQ